MTVIYLENVFDATPVICSKKPTKIKQCNKLIKNIRMVDSKTSYKELNESVNNVCSWAYLIVYDVFMQEFFC